MKSWTEDFCGFVNSFPSTRFSSCEFSAYKGLAHAVNEDEVDAVILSLKAMLPALEGDYDGAADSAARNRSVS